MQLVLDRELQIRHYASFQLRVLQNCWKSKLKVRNKFQAQAHPHPWRLYLYINTYYSKTSWDTINVSRNKSCTSKSLIWQGPHHGFQMTGGYSVRNGLKCIRFAKNWRMPCCCCHIWRVAATCWLKLTGGMPPMQPALTRALSDVYYY